MSRSNLYRLNQAGEILRLRRASRILAEDVDSWASSLPSRDGHM